MFKLGILLKSAFVGAILAMTPLAASAVTVINDGDSVTIGPGGVDYEFLGNVTGDGSAGSWSVDFTALADPLGAGASVTLGGITLGVFTDLTMSWISVLDGDVLGTLVVSLLDTSLSTIFLSPDDQSQTLLLTWSSSLDGAGFDVEVSAVPLPAAGLLLFGALGGLGFVGRRRRKAA